MRQIRVAIGLAGALALAAHSPVEAQLRQVGQRSGFGFYGTLARPVGEFQNYVEWGGGGGLYGVVNLDRRGPIGVRFEGNFLIYGHERFQVPFRPDIGRVALDVSTDNFIVGLGIGPQLTLGSGWLRPYGYGTAGFSYFATVSSLSGSNSDETFASTTNFDDFSLALSWGGGLLLRLHRGRHSTWLDLGVQSTYHGETAYLREGGVVDNPDGSVTVYPIRSDANLMTFRLGITIGL